MTDQRSVSDDEVDLSAEDDYGPEMGPRQIPVSVFMAGDPLYVPPGWRKSLRDIKRDPQQGLLFGDDDPLPKKHQPAPGEADGDESADERS